jgi:hypothetical protein
MLIQYKTESFLVNRSQQGCLSLLGTNETNRNRTKSTILNHMNIIDSKNKPNRINNQSMAYAKLGTTKSHDQSITMFNYRKMNLQDPQQIVFDDQTIT